MDSPFTISEAQLAAMTAEQQTSLFNVLIRDEARRLDMRPDQVQATDAIDMADEAIDAITEGAPTGGDHIPAGDALWQFKKPTPRWKKLTQDLTRSPTAQEFFRRGSAYTYIEGNSLSAAVARRRQRDLEQAVEAAGCTGRIRFMAAGHAAAWASRVPAAIFSVQRETHEYLRADRMLASVPHVGIEYQPDELRLATIAALRDRLLRADRETYTARLVGPAGVGKTRLALECLADAELTALAMYAIDPPSLELFTWLEANPEVEAIIVIDECDELEAEKYEQLAAMCEGRLRLLTVGIGRAGLGGERTFSLNPLDDEAMERVVKSVTTVLFPEQVRWVVEQTRGYVKLARAVALGLARGAIDYRSLHSDEDVRRAIQKLVLSDEQARRALSGVALLIRLGFCDEVVDEGRVVADFMGLSWDQMRNGVSTARAEGLVSVKGRYWYVSPDFLAATLAAEVWSQQPDRIEELHSRLPIGARDSFLERLSSLGVPGASDAIGKLLGGNGPFRDIDSLDDSQAASLFQVLAKGAPGPAVRRLEEILGSSGRERLRSFVRGRREIVWTLQHLASRADTFSSAAGLLLLLGETENESYGNNASGTWASLFLTFLGTEAPAEDRIQVLRGALESDHPERRLLAITALGSALDSQEFGLSLESSTTPRRWRPPTWGDIWRYKRAAVHLLMQALDAADEIVRKAAAEQLLAHVRMLADVQLADQSILILRRLRDSDLVEIRRVWEEARAIVAHERRGLTAEQADELEALASSIYGDSLTDRVKRYTGKWSWVDWPGSDAAEARPESIAAELADEVFSKRDVLAELIPWLTSREAEGVWPFGHRLGVLDESRDLFAQILDGTRAAKNAMFITSFLSGRWTAGDHDWVHSTVDVWASSDDDAALAVEATVRLRGTDRSVTRLFTLVDSGMADAGALTWTYYGRWLENVSIDLQIQVVERLMDVKMGGEAAYGITHDLLSQMDSPKKAIVDLGYTLLEREETEPAGSMVSFYWSEIAKVLARRDPVRIGRLVVRLFVTGSPKFYDDRLELLKLALQAEPQGTWEVIASALEDGRAYHLVWELERSGTVDDVPLPVLKQWLDSQGERGAQLLTSITKPKPGVNDDLIELLLQIGKDVDGTLISHYWTEGFSGPESLFLREKIDGAQHWLESDSPLLESWARRLVETLEKRIPSAHLEEEEW